MDCKIHSISHNILITKKFENPKKKNIAAIDETPWGGREENTSILESTKKKNDKDTRNHGQFQINPFHKFF